MIFDRRAEFTALSAQHGENRQVFASSSRGSRQGLSLPYSSQRAVEGIVKIAERNLVKLEDGRDHLRRRAQTSRADPSSAAHELGSES